MKYFCFLFLFLSITLSPNAQLLSGRWEGVVTQEGKNSVFYYEIDVVQEGNAVSGTSYSVSKEGETEARFEISGVWDGQQLTLQEISQLEPEEPKWCLKFATLQFKMTDEGYQLDGEWRAPGCTPGRMTLTRIPTRTTTDTLEQELPFELSGAWTGHLSQSDRDYGFFFELTLEEAPEGSSYIVSEDNGGSAHHALRWSYDEAKKLLVFKEHWVTEKTDPRWPWCIKRGALQLRRDGMRYVLEGPWEGFIEGFESGSDNSQCAPGTVYLEKPVLTKTIVRQNEIQQQAYTATTQRKVKIERTLEVRSRQLYLRVWDNGTVDGDICTLFLNGRRILHNYRVSKHKWAIPITLEESNNFLILHADDLGDITPNTVAVSVDDGYTEQIVIVSSNLKESGAVMIREVKVD